MRIMGLLRADQHSEAGAPPSPELMAKMGTFIQEIMQAGVLKATDGLHPTSKGKRVRLSGGKVTVTDGPFTESKELIASYALFEVKTMAEAVEWTKRFLQVLGEGECELRPLFEASDFAPPEGAAKGYSANLAPADGKRSNRSSCRQPTPIAPSTRSGVSSRPGSSPAWRGWCATSAWPRTSPRTRS
jgi:hypothetical protein